ncbi:MAG: hypothetical protein ACUVQW_00700 [Candidatus Bathycorpusculaceae bacterium]
MTKLTPLLTSLKKLDITYKTPKETLLETPETLPTSEPDTPQISYTVAEDDLPTFSMVPYQKVWVANVFGGGKAVTATNIYWRMKKNGESVNTGYGSVSANYFFTRNCYFYDVKVGDVLELALWSNQTDSTWDYKAFQIQVTRLILLNKPRLLLPCNFASLETHPVLTLGNPSWTGQALYPYHCDYPLSTITSATSYSSLYPKDTYGLFRLNYGDYNQFNSAPPRTSATYRPYYYRNFVPTQLTMRGLKTEGQL